MTDLGPWQEGMPEEGSLFASVSGEPRKVWFYPSTKQPLWRRLLRRPKPLPYFFGTATFTLDLGEDGVDGQ